MNLSILMILLCFLFHFKMCRKKIWMENGESISYSLNYRVRENFEGRKWFSRVVGNQSNWY